MPTRARLVAALATALAGAALLGPARARAAGGESVLEIGGTFSVAGEPDNGGVSFGISYLWPLEERFRVGVMGYADELGDGTTRLTGPNGEDLGPVSAGARYTWGGGLRLEAHARNPHTIDPYVLMTWGFYKVQDYLRGAIASDVAAGVGLGMGARRAMNDRHSIGVVLRGQWLSNGDARRYASAAVEWRWGRGGGASSTQAVGMTTPR